MLTPSDSSMSALPVAPDAALFPCFATITPEPATAKPAVVEMLKVPERSPPVPQVSTSGPSTSTCRDLSRITLAIPAISAGVSPLRRSAVTNAPNWAGVASPSMISSMAAAASSLDSGLPSTSFSIVSRIIGLRSAFRPSRRVCHPDRSDSR